MGAADGGSPKTTYSPVSGLEVVAAPGWARCLLEPGGPDAEAFRYPVDPALGRCAARRPQPAAAVVASQPEDEIVLVGAMTSLPSVPLKTAMIPILSTFRWPRVVSRWRGPPGVRRGRVLDRAAAPHPPPPVHSQAGRRCLMVTPPAAEVQCAGTCGSDRHEMAHACSVASGPAPPTIRPGPAAGHRYVGKCHHRPERSGF
jgi:hypothetical protein